MQIAATLADKAILLEIGQRIAQVRISQAITQQALAQRAGIAKRTLERLERGDSVQLLTLIRAMRELSLLENLNVLAPDTGPRPLDYISRKGRPRRRAPRSSAMVLREPQTPWKWGDES